MASEAGWGDRATSVLQIREGEGRIVAWLFAHAFFGGIPLTLTSAASNALFLEHHGAAMLPWVYLAAAAVVPLIGWMCLRIERAVSFDRFLITVVMLILGGQLAARASVVLLGAERGTWLLPLWTELEYSLTSLELWALAGRLLNVQQTKRLLGVVGSGGPLAGGVAGVLSPLLVRGIGTPNLLLVSAMASLASLFVLRRICAQQRERLSGHASDDEEGREGEQDRKPKKKKRKLSAADEAKKKDSTIPSELRPYVRATYALMALAFVSYYFIERLFYDRAEARIPDTEALASFLGVFVGVCSLVSLIFRVWLSAQILARWGLLVGLLTLPLLIALFSATATVTGLIAGASAFVLFLAVTGLRAADRVLHESLDLQAAFMLYQPLPKATRVKVQGTGEAIIGPLAGGFAGALLIVLEKLDVDVVRLAALLAGIGALWFIVANHLRRAYRVVLERALADRRLKRDELVLGESARVPLLRALESNWAGEVLYALDMLEALGWRTVASSSSSKTREARDLRPVTVLKKLLEHSSSYVRREALRRIEKGALTDLIPEVVRLAEHEVDDRVRARANRVLVAIAEDDDAERIWMEGSASADARIRREVMTGCLASGSIDRIALAWHELRRLAESTDPQQRILAAQVLRKVGSSTFHRPLLKLLGDQNRNVQRAAIVACKSVRHPRLLPIIVRALRSRGLRAPAAATLIAIGPSILPLVRDYAHESRDWRVRVRALRVAQRVKGPVAERLALDFVESPEEEVRHAALLALVASGYRPRKRNLLRAAIDRSGKAASSRAPQPPSSSAVTPASTTPASAQIDKDVDVETFEQLLRTEVADATWTLAALIDLEVATRRLSLIGPPPSSVVTNGSPRSIIPTASLSPKPHRDPVDVALGNISVAPSPPSDGIPSAPGSNPASSAGAPSSQGSQDLDPDGMALVTRALRRELANGRERILLLLSFLYDPQAMHAARASYASPSTDRRAIALELLDNALPASVRSLIIPLFDDLSAKEALAVMPDEVTEDEEQQGRRGRLRDLMSPDRTNVTSWTRTCAVWALRDPDVLKALESSTDDDVRETVRFLLHGHSGAISPVNSLAPPQSSLAPANTLPPKSKGSLMLTIEKVLILRSVPMFERTPDHILSELAVILKEVDLGPDVDFIKEGDFGDCMFVIVHGAVKVHRGGELIAELGARDIVGEMSVLDPEPRSASVTTTKPTRLLRIDRDDFFDLMADRIEIAQGILGVLCQRLRGFGGEVESRPYSLHPPSTMGS